MSDETNDIQTVANTTPATSAFNDAGTFELAQRQARALSNSELVPQQFRGDRGMANTLIALELAQRTGASPLFVMQGLHIIQGRPTWSAQFVIGVLNACGRFSPLRFALSGEGDARDCYCWATDLATGDRLEGPAASLEMANAEGWARRNGSKWQTMPELMLRYRAATFFGRLYAPDLLLGMQTADEVREIEVDAKTGEVLKVRGGRGVAGVKEALRAQAPVE